MAISDEVVETVGCHSAEEFLNYLWPVHPRWSDYEDKSKNPWVYRGHWDSEWELKPPAWRSDGRKKLEPLAAQLHARASAIVEDKSASGWGNLHDSRELAFTWVLYICRRCDRQLNSTWQPKHR